MKKGFIRFILVGSAAIIDHSLFAQSSTSGSSYLIGGIIVVAILLVFGVIVLVGDNLISIEAKQSGVDKRSANLAVFPNWKELFAPKIPGYANSYRTFILRKGFTIKLLGEAGGDSIREVEANTYAIQPPNFLGIAPIPKLEVEVGDNVQAGDPVFHDKSNPDIKYVAPVSGEIIAINRGDKRSIVEIVILADKDQKYRSYTLPNLAQCTREELRNFLMSSGGWTLIHQRPYKIVADPEVEPRDIFISTFDSAPLAPDMNIAVAGREDAFAKGLEVLKKLTPGNVYLGLDANGKTAPSRTFTEAEGVEKYWFMGEHPSGNVGVQIHHIAPISPKDKVWTLGVQEVITLGNLFLHGKWDSTRVVAVTGAELKACEYVRVKGGANIGDIMGDNLFNTHTRLISGNVLTGEAKIKENFLNFYDSQITAVAEGDYFEPFGWLLPQKGRPSHSHTYPDFLFPDAKYRVDTNTHGERRAFVVTGEYEDVLPMNIYPQHLMKAILANDFERMEGLGIHELVEEDVALCEFVCTSKQPLQRILRTGLEQMRGQG